MPDAQAGLVYQRAETDEAGAEHDRGHAGRAPNADQCRRAAAAETFLR